MNDENYKEALYSFLKLGDFKDSESCCKDIIAKNYEHIFQGGMDQKAFERYKNIIGVWMKNDECTWTFDIDGTASFNDNTANGAKMSNYIIDQNGKICINLGSFTDSVYIENEDHIVIESEKNSSLNKLLLGNYIKKWDSVEEQYDEAIMLYQAGNYDEAEEIFKLVIDYKDSREYVEQCQKGSINQAYEEAQKAELAKDYSKALELYTNCQGYKDSNDKINQIKWLQLAENEEVDEITFGNYAGEDIEWIVVDDNSSDVVLISKYVLEIHAFDNGNNYKWDNCDLRKWLNGTFYKDAFDDSEKTLLSLTSTKDYVSILSENEITKYHFDETKAQGTEHAVGATNVVMGSGYCQWWVRTEGVRPRTVKFCSVNGFINERGEKGSVADIGVRPYISLNKKKIKEMYR